MPEYDSFEPFYVLSQLWYFISSACISIKSVCPVPNDVVNLVDFLLHYRNFGTKSNREILSNQYSWLALFPLTKKLKINSYTVEVYHYIRAITQMSSLLHFLIWFGQLDLICFVSLYLLPVLFYQALWLGLQAFLVALECRPGSYTSTIRFLKSEINTVQLKLTGLESESSSWFY